MSELQKQFGKHKDKQKNIQNFWRCFCGDICFCRFQLCFFGETEREKDAPIAETKQTELPGTPLEFSLLDDYKVIKKAATGRHRLEMTILPKSGQETATQADLISTVMHVAHEAYQRTAAPVTIVNMLAQNTGNAWADRQLAFIVYIPDQKGFDGKTASKNGKTLPPANGDLQPTSSPIWQLWGQLRNKIFIRRPAECLKTRKKPLQRKLNRLWVKNSIPTPCLMSCGQ